MEGLTDSASSCRSDRIDSRERLRRSRRGNWLKAKQDQTDRACGGCGQRSLTRPQAALVLEEPGDLIDTLAGAQIAEDERTRAAHALGVALHDLERGADMGR